MTLADPRAAQAFRFVRRHYANGVAELVYAFDDGPELVENIVFLDCAGVAAGARGRVRCGARHPASDRRHQLTTRRACRRRFVSSRSAGRRHHRVPRRADRHGLGEFAYQNRLDLRGRIRFPATAAAAPAAARVSLPRRTLVPIGGGKDSLVSVGLLAAADEDATAVWVGNSPLIAACAARTGLPLLNLRRGLSPSLFDYNKGRCLQRPCAGHCDQFGDPGGGGDSLRLRRDRVLQRALRLQRNARIRRPADQSPMEARAGRSSRRSATAARARCAEP